MTLIPRMALGRFTLPALLMAQSPDYLDDSLPYVTRLRTNRFPPAGIGGEAAFHLLYLALSHQAASTPLQVRVLIDDVALPLVNVTLTSDGTTRKNTVLELSLRQPIPGHETRGLFAIRGCWVQVEVLTAFVSAAAFLQIDAAEVEIDVVREGKRQGANP